MIRRLLLLLTALFVTGFTTNALAADAPPFGYAQLYTLEVSDPASLLAAMQKFRSSSVGMKNPSGVSLNQFLANGDDESTHSIIVTYPSAAAMDASRKMNMGTEEWGEAAASFQAAAEFTSESISQLLNARINQPDLNSMNPVSMSIGLGVSNPGAFMEAFTKLWDSSAAKTFPGNSYLVNVLASGESAITHAVVFQAKDMATLLSAMDTLQSSPEMTAYLKRAGSFRTVVSRTVGINLWNSPIPGG